MFKITHKQIIAQDIKRIDIAAPIIAATVLPGQFVMVTPDASSHAMPMTVVDNDERKGTVSLIVHEVGASSRALGALSIGQGVSQCVGPMGRPADIRRYGTVICVATGIGAAQVLPVCRALKKQGNRVIGIIGAKSKKVLMLEAQMRVVCDEIFITTNDGSYERRGLASGLLQELLPKYKAQAVYAIGSVEMMQEASRLAKAAGIPVHVMLNAYMINGLGICGSCRVKVGEAFRLACVDGPFFDGTAVDFDDVNRRDQAMKVKTWDKQNLPSNRGNAGLTALWKPWLGMGKNKT